MREKIIDALRAAGVVTVERSGGGWGFTDASGAFVVLRPEEIMLLLSVKPMPAETCARCQLEHAAGDPQACLDALAAATQRALEQLAVFDREHYRANLRIVRGAAIRMCEVLWLLQEDDAQFPRKTNAS